MTVAYGNMNQSQRHRTSSGALMSHGGEQMLLVSYVHCGDSESSMPATTELMVDCTVLTIQKWNMYSATNSSFHFMKYMYNQRLHL